MRQNEGFRQACAPQRRLFRLQRRRRAGRRRAGGALWLRASRRDQDRSIPRELGRPAALRLTWTPSRIAWWTSIL